MSDEVSALVNWLQERVGAAEARGAVVGLSGGIDSALVLALCTRAFGEATCGVIMPCHSGPDDAESARLAARTFGVTPVEVDLGPAYDALLAALPKESGEGLWSANLKPRLRMATLYAIAGQRGRLVVGTGNRSELYLGYFTKYGDGGVDLLPLAEFTKHEVRALARQAGVPEAIIARAPSAGLWEGQTDEGEMGFTYAELDAFLQRGEATEQLREKLVVQHAASEHKRRMPEAYRRTPH